MARKRIESGLLVTDSGALVDAGRLARAFDLAVWLSWSYMQNARPEGGRIHASLS
jgi:hypothetical protein